MRVNQVGYFFNDPKIAILSSESPLSGSFSVADFRGSIGQDRGPWGPFQHNYRLDFTEMRTPGRYRVKCGKVVSLPFTIGSDVYREALTPCSPAMQ